MSYSGNWNLTKDIDAEYKIDKRKRKMMLGQKEVISFMVGKKCL